MRFIRVIVRPPTYTKGRSYLLRLRQGNGKAPEYVPVIFVEYEPCPAVVCVSDEDGKLWRIPREDLFTCELAPRD
jgi:hypothetical protein